ncbi:MAG: DMT family transporter [Limnochordia bacterium]|mgnify:FL=1|jgi:drug/metabolite transporter (DMT)-like permease|nr:DMT family transporter [Limnochordia bacterium]MDI9465568.1 DMT family transporter [Bacillota bacterium]HOK30539.1 DMT family transporter [Limnochordia bacterium]HOL99384.1 DMT family transporter [Limnochordia bacterium]HOQ73287.1 DMT family transporter [Limnochordia bacterium]
MAKEKLITLVLVGGVAAISTSAVLIRLAEAPPFVIAFYRMLFAALFFLPLALREGRGLRLEKQQLRLALGAGVMLAMHFALWMTSLEHTSVASSVVLVTTQPLWVFLLSVLFLAEKPTPRMWLGLVVALAGSVLVTFTEGAGGESRLYGNLLALGGAVAMACYFLLGRRLRPQLPLALYSLLVYGGAALVLGFLILLRGLPLRGFNSFTWLMFVALALVPTVLGHNSLNWALKYLPATMVSVTILGEPLGASIMAVFILKEVPAPLEALGSVITLFGIYLVWQGNARREKA